MNISSAPPSTHQVPRASLLVGVLAVALASLYGVSEFVAPVYQEVKARQGLLQATGSATEVVTLGHSHNRAILLAAFAPAQGFHLWRSARDPFETHWAFEEERSSLRSLRVVLVAVAPFSWDNTATPTAARDRRRELYALHPAAGRWHTDVGLRLHAFAAPLMRGDHWKGVLYRLAGRPLDFEVGQNGWIDDRPRDTVRDAAALDSIAVITASAHLALDAQTQASQPTHCAAAADALASLPMIAGPGTTVVFYTPPYWSSYLARLETSPTCDLRSVARRLATDSAAVRYFDDSEHPAFIEQASLFLDADHLNVYGAARYSALLRERLDQDLP